MRPSRIFHASLVTTVATVLVFGCSSTAPRTSMDIEAACTRTECDDIKAREGSYCSDCTLACAQAEYNCNPSTACAQSCADHKTTCSADEEAHCVTHGFKVDLPENASSELEAACKRMFTQMSACGASMGSHYPTDCAVWAKTERPERAATYDCAANVDCDGDTSACEPEPTTFGDDLCDALDAKCADTCTQDMRDGLNADGAWLRDDVQKAVWRCVEQDSCDQMTSCYNAWVSAARL